MLHVFDRSFFMRTIVSSAYCKIDKQTFTRCGTTPFILTSSLLLFKRIADMSAIMLKSNGDKGLWSRLLASKLAYTVECDLHHGFLEVRLRHQNSG